MAETSRKIFNYDSVILHKETIEKYGYNPDELGKTSKKFIVCTCRYCGKPHDIRKGFFMKSGSACHKECKNKEMKQQDSPLKHKESREKARQTNLKRYGCEHPSQNKQVAAKISKKRKSNKKKIEAKIMEKYNVRNVSQLPEIKEKVKKTNREKFGVDYPLQNPEILKRVMEDNNRKYGKDCVLSNEEIKKKIRETVKEKYGEDHIQKNKEIRSKAQYSFDQSIVFDENDNYNLINTLRSDEFWEKLEKESLKSICEYFDLNYGSLTSALLRDEFRDRYYQTYTFPTLQGQKELYNWLKENGSNVVMNDRTVIGPLELDLVDKDKKVALEYNGSYWHSEAVLEGSEAKNKHVDKMRLCEEKGYRLVHLFEHTYLNRKESTLNYLRSVFGLNKNKIPARKCVITHDNSDSFIEKYHIQGSPPSTLKYFNLVYNGEIVGVMTAGKHHERGGDDSCILTRLVFKENTTVQGGSSKLFKHFVKWAKEKGYSQIISWSDNTISQGGVYDILGFVLERTHSPSYFYFDAIEGVYRTKQSQRKTNKDRPEGVTIRQWNNARNMFAIWDCGKKKWVYNLEEVKYCGDKNINDLIQKIQNNLTFDFILPEYRGKTPLHGSCYVATETLYHLLNDFSIFIKKFKYEKIGVTHWWLEKNGEIIDPSKEQYDFEFPYFLGDNASFLTKNPSKRSVKLMEKIKND